MVVRASSMEVPAARFDEGGGGKMQEKDFGEVETPPVDASEREGDV